MVERICRVEALPEGARRVVSVRGHEVVVLRTASGLRALGNRCPHRGGLLSEGDLEADHLYCPLHAWCFDIRNGRAFFPAGASVPAFSVRENEGWIELEVP